jgi:hypothetical protein
MPRDEDKAKVGERITGVHDPKDPDGLITLEKWREIQQERSGGDAADSAERD